MKKIDFLKTIAVAGVFAMATNTNAQVALTKTLPPVGTTFESWTAPFNSLGPGAIATPDTGANVTWNYDTVSLSKIADRKIQALSDAPSSEQTLVPDAIYVEEVLLYSGANASWNPRNFFKDAGDYLIQIAEKTVGSGAPQIHNDTVFKFNVPYQGTVNLKLANYSGNGGVGTFRYSGYGTLILGGNTYTDVVQLKEEGNNNNFYFFTLTPHYHYLARINFSGSNYWNIGVNKPTGTTPATPAAPSNLTATPVNSMDLNWQDNSNDEDGFYIESTQDTIAGSWTQIASVASDVTYYHHTGLNPGEDYFYRVRAYNANGNSAYSNIAGATEMTTGINDITLNSFTAVYPNPANTMLNISVKENTNIKIVDMLGAVVATQQLQTGNNTVDVNHLTKGIYFISNDKGGVAKFIKE